MNAMTRREFSLAVLAATAPADCRGPVEVIALTCAEVRRLLTTLIVKPDRTRACPLAWSRWRRRHQHHARTSHYQRQQATQSYP